jgi:glutathione synthase
MTIQLGVVMDPISGIQPKKDSTLAMLHEANERGWKLYYFEQKDLFLRDGIPFGHAKHLSVNKQAAEWFSFTKSETIALSDLDVILMRKDPPVDETFIYTTYLLEHAERQGVLVVNKAQSLRDANEKLFATCFPQCTPPTLVTQSKSALHAFWKEHEDIVCKPLNTMGGTMVFRLQKHDVNANTIFDVLTKNGTDFTMAQRFIPEIRHGDKRILMIDGEPVPHVLARMPQGNDWRGNLAVGAKGVVQPLSARDRWICNEVGPELRKRGLYFVGLDVIGDYLTEINVTSPTGIREIDAGANINVSGMFLDCITALLTHGASASSVDKSLREE